MKITTEIKKIKIANLLKLDNTFDIFDYQYSTTKTEKILQKKSTSDAFTNINMLISKDLYPPIPIFNETLIWGFHLLRIAQNISKEYLLCRLLENQRPIDMVTIALSMENRPGKYSMEEQARLLQLLANLKIQPDTEETGKIILLINGHFDPNWSKKVEQYINFPKSLKTLVNNNLIDHKTALRVQKLPSEIFTRLANSKLSFSEKRILLNLFYEIVERDKLGKHQIKEEFTTILSAKNPLQTITGKRFPRLTRMEEEYKRLKKKYLKGKGIEIKMPQYFEGDKLTVNLSIRDKEEFQTKIKELENLKDVIDEFFQILR